MGLLTFGLFMLAIVLIYLYFVGKAVNRKMKPTAPAKAKPENKGLYRIYFDGTKNWYDPMQAIINELPKLNSSVGRWELFIDSEAGRDHLVLNWLDQVTGEVVNVSRVDLTDAGYRSSWRALDGCGKEYQNEQVRSVVVMPVLKHVAYEFKYGKLKGAIKPEPRSYTII